MSFARFLASLLRGPRSHHQPESARPGEDRSSKRRSRDERTRLVLASVSIAVAVGCLGYLAAVTASVVSGERSDILADWVVVSAVRDRLDPGSGVIELARELGVTYTGVPFEGLGGDGPVHPRPPGALLLMSPLLLVAWQDVYGIWLPVNAVGAALLGVLSVLLVPPRHRLLVVALMPLAFASAPLLRGLEFGTHSAWLAVLIWFFVERNRNRDSIAGGAALGVAIAMRLFPALLLVPAIFHRRAKAVGTACAVALVATAGGLLLPGVSLADSLQNLRLAGEQWGSVPVNGSLSAAMIQTGIVGVWAGPLAVSIATIGTILVSRSQRFSSAAIVAVWLAVLGSPLSWDHYDLLLFPAILVLGVSPDRWIRLVARGVLLAWSGGLMWIAFGGGEMVSSTPYIVALRIIAGVAVLGACTVSARTSRTGPHGRRTELVRTPGLVDDS